MGEFDLIRQYFQQAQNLRYARIGIGDDCAVFAPSAGCELAVSTDTLIEGRHFLSNVRPYTLAYKALAVSLSDLAAAGAMPKAFLLNLSLPKARAKHEFLIDFAEGLFACAKEFNCELIGGDTTQSETLMLASTVFGEVPAGQALLRCGAKANDEIWVSGTLGCAAAGLGFLQNKVGFAANAFCQQRLETPTPRIALGLALRGIASSCMDLSDGLVGDLNHILRASQCDASLNLETLPTSKAFEAATQGLNQAARLALQLAGGDDYELLFTAHLGKHAEIKALSQALNLPLTRIGQIELMQAAAPSLSLQLNGAPYENTLTAYDHFA